MILRRDLLKPSHFHTNLSDMASLYGLYAQFLTMPLPKGPFTDQIVIVTGSNSGIGLEAARHYVRLDAKKVILAVRNMESGNAAKKSIEESTQRLDVVEVWNLDMSRSASVREFSQRVTRELQIGRHTSELQSP